MSKICYTPKNFCEEHLEIIEIANEILDRYATKGYDVTLRQLYYQFVTKQYLPNKDSEYKRLGSIINDARLAGLIDWNYIVDITRNLKSVPHWNKPKDILEVAAEQFKIEKWEIQPIYCEVWIEKDALLGVLGKACEPLDVPYFSCRGYTSQSEMWAAAMRLLDKFETHDQVVVIHLGDHDPSGIDMSRDISDRIKLFMEHHNPRATGNFTMHRIALNMDQIKIFNPPPNPAKITDSRSSSYIRQYGNNSWELDALDVEILSKLIELEILRYRDEELWQESLAIEEPYRQQLKEIAKNCN
jgi:hypothetical protein